MEDKHLCNKSTNVSVLKTAITTTTYLLCIFVGSLSGEVGNLLVITPVIYSYRSTFPQTVAVTDLLVGVLVLPFRTILAVSSC